LAELWNHGSKWENKNKFFTLWRKYDNITNAILYILYAPVAQGIEHRPPEAGAAVRIRPGVYLKKKRRYLEEAYEESF
jgi:hypothetical protein